MHFKIYTERKLMLMNELFIEKFLQSIYLSQLGREPDKTGFNYWANRINRIDDCITVLHEISNSPEAMIYRAQQQIENKIKSEMINFFCENLKSAIRILDIGSLELKNEQHFWLPLSNYLNLEVTGFDPQLPSRKQILPGLNESKKISFTNLNYALGDNEKRSFYINNIPETSSLFPIIEDSVFFELQALKCTMKEDVETVRLDDIVPFGNFQLIKLDVQGAELQILKNSEFNLKSASIIYVEVEHQMLYEGQPLYWEIDCFLRNSHFELVDLFNVYGTLSNSQNFKLPQTLLWSDALYIREDADFEMLNFQGLVLGVIFNKWNIAESIYHKIKK